MAMKPSTAIGEWRNEVTVEAPSGAPIPDGDGQFTQAYAELDPPTWPCKITAASAQDMKRAIVGTIQSTETLVLSGPFHPGITTTTRISWTDAAGRSRTANVKGVTNPDGICVETVLQCVEVVT